MSMRCNLACIAVAAAALSCAGSRTFVSSASSVPSVSTISVTRPVQDELEAEALPYPEAERSARADEAWRLFFEGPPRTEAAKAIVRRLRIGPDREGAKLDVEPLARSRFVRIGTWKSTVVVERSSFAFRAFLPFDASVFRDVGLGDVLVAWSDAAQPTPGIDPATRLWDLDQMRIRRGVELARRYARGGPLLFAYAPAWTESGQETITVLDPRTLAEVRTLSVPERWGGEPDALRPSPDGSVVALCWGEGVRLWSVHSGDELRKDRAIEAVAFDRARREMFLLTPGAIERVGLPDLSRRVSRPLVLPARRRAPDLRSSPDGRYLVVVADDEMAVLDARSLDVLVPYQPLERPPPVPGAPAAVFVWNGMAGPEPRASIEFSTDGQFLVAQDHLGGITAHELVGAKERRLSREAALAKALEIGRASAEEDEARSASKEALRTQMESRVCVVKGYVFPKELCE